MNLTRYKFLSILIMLALAVLVLFLLQGNSKLAEQNIFQVKTFWKFQSIDTMKYSRDLARQEMGNPAFDSVIDRQIGDIASTGATHVGIATPYDQEFVPILARWVASARSHNLNVWFRGNFSGWEGWFDYPKITRDQHLQMTHDFIIHNPELFADGDIFSSCPECENGGPGDPRKTGDVKGFREFIINEDETAQAGFTEIGKSVTSNFFSMNGDVAKLVMDKDTTTKLGGVVVIDHYVSLIDKMISDIDALAASSGGKIVLGEFGAPIPDLNGNFTDEQQKNWMQEALDKLVLNKNVIGLNYWVNTGGSTQIWTESGQVRPAVSTVTDYYKPILFSGEVLNELSNPIPNADVKSFYREVKTDHNGQFIIPMVADKDSVVQISADGYVATEIPHGDSKIVLVKTNPQWWFKLLKKVKGK